jgi:hypothetical protein
MAPPTPQVVADETLQVVPLQQPAHEVASHRHTPPEQR